MTIYDIHRHRLNQMPVDIEILEEADALPIKPNTNEHALLSVLADHPQKGFTSGELATLADVAPGTASKSLSRLEEKGLVRKLDGYWAVADDRLASRVASIISLEAIEARYGDDVYGRSDDWVDELPDLGENA